jgi:uncharacterized protein DUF885
VGTAAPNCPVEPSSTAFAGEPGAAVPLDRATAMEDATFYASVPGVGISYQMGKLQIMKLLAEARLAQGDKFNLREFHDSIWKTATCPLPCCGTNTWARRTRSKCCSFELRS